MPATTDDDDGDSDGGGDGERVSGMAVGHSIKLVDGAGHLP
jgi:hypothetical protein